jgi:hypothetical protein
MPVIFHKQIAPTFMEDNFMRLIQGFIVLCLCVLLGTCFLDKNDGVFDVDIGDYEEQLYAWNSRNMLNYEIKIDYRVGAPQPEKAFVTVKNGIPECNYPSYWLKYKRPSTIPEFYSLIKSYEKTFTDAHNSGDNNLMRLKVNYNTEYHYPSLIISEYKDSITKYFIIELFTPAEKTE